MKKLFYCVLFFLMILTQTSYAEKWQSVGARAMAMGGAGVAAATGSAQQYYNPALLATKNGLHDNDVLLNVNVEIEATEKLLTAAGNLRDLTDKYKEIKDLSSKATADQMKSIIKTFSALHDLNLKNTGVLVGANTGLATKIKRIAVSVRSYVSAGITPIVDTHNIGLKGAGTNISLGDKTTTPAGYETAVDIIKNALDKTNLASSLSSLFGESYNSSELAKAIVNMAKDAGSSVEQVMEMANALAKELPNASDIITAGVGGGNYKDNSTQVLVDAGAFTEVALGYGCEVFKGIQVGGNIKFINGQMAETGVLVLSDDNKIEDTIEDAFKERKSTNNFGIDLGVLFDFNRFFDRNIILSPKIGIVAKNINNPSFERPDRPKNADVKLQWNSSSYSLEKQYRAGAAVKPLNWLTVAADMDIVKNKTMVSGFDSQDFAFGVEALLINKTSFAIPLRAGLNKNIANSNSALEYTAGIGFNGTGFTLELAGGISTKTTKFDDTEIPASASVAFNLGVLF